MTKTMEELLAMAAADEVFRAELLADRQAAVRSRGIELSETDAAMLSSVPDDQLAAMLDQLAAGDVTTSPSRAMPVCTGIRPEREPVKGIRPGRILLTAAAGTVLVGGGYAAWRSMTAATGSRPDLPPTVQRPLHREVDSAASDAPADAGVASTKEDS